MCMDTRLLVRWQKGKMGEDLQVHEVAMLPVSDFVERPVVAQQSLDERELLAMLMHNDRLMDAAALGKQRPFLGRRELLIDLKDVFIDPGSPKIVAKLEAVECARHKS